MLRHDSCLGGSEKVINFLGWFSVLIVDGKHLELSFLHTARHCYYEERMENNKQQHRIKNKLGPQWKAAQ